MYERAKTFTLTRPRVKKTVGWVLIVLGIVGLIAPIIPGAVLLFVGLELLGFQLLFLDKFLGRTRTTAGE